MQALAAAPAASALLAQQPAAAPAQPATNPDDLPKLDFSVADEGGDPIQSFFNPRQAAALRRLCELMLPIAALNAKVPEFMDFMIGRAPTDRQQIWLSGLDALNYQSETRFQKSFADISDAQADALLAPIREPWTYDVPGDPVGRLLRAAKADIRLATFNSLELHISAAGGKRPRGQGQLYWLPIE